MWKISYSVWANLCDSHTKCNSQSNNSCISYAHFTWSYKFHTTHSYLCKYWYSCPTNYCLWNWKHQCSKFWNQSTYKYHTSSNQQNFSGNYFCHWNNAYVLWISRSRKRPNKCTNNTYNTICLDTTRQFYICRFTIHSSNSSAS